MDGAAAARAGRHAVLDNVAEGRSSCGVSRRTVIKALGLAAAGAPLAVFGQGRCLRKAGTPGCNTEPIAEVFAATGWKTTALDRLTFHVADYRKEARFYAALMGWSVRSDDGKRAILDMGDWGSAILQRAAREEFGGSAGSDGEPVHAVVKSFCFVIEPWRSREVEAELRRRGLAPVSDNDGHGFESFHVKDPDGFDLQISNGNGLAKSRRERPAQRKIATALPFEPTGWKSVWLDHLSFKVTNYKKSASFYCQLLGWKPTYDEGSQKQCQMGDVGDIIIRGGNPLAPNFAPDLEQRGGRGALLDHISVGVEPWDTEGVRAALEKRGLEAHVDTAASGDDIHSAAYKSYHTTTPNGYNLQISDITRETRSVLPNAVKPKTAE
jgi:catechol 2,3-dioxygenase-like lactoylglutathione lyase family enzyme